MSRDTRKELPRIRARVVVLLTTDNLPKGAAAEVAALYREQLAALPNHELIVMNGSKHYVMFDAADEFFASLDRFLGLRSQTAQ
jgi:pimeloyl-ACP methyl ester carboxylesterase